MGLAAFSAHKSLGAQMAPDSGDEASLFPPRERTDTSPAGHIESRYSFLDRVDSVFFARVRDLMNDWFASLPEEIQDDLGARWRSGDDRQAMAAFWEMYLFVAHRRTGFQVHPHPSVPEQTKRPDF